jgi:hypothetical protein
MRIRTLTAPAALLTGALLLTACGGDSPLEGKNGPEVAELAADALEEAGAVHMSGSMVQDGEETEIDLQLQGDDAAGSITVQGTEIELISVGGDVFLKATEDLLTSFGAPAEAAAEYEGQWIQMPSEDAAEFSDFTLENFVKELRDPEGEIKDETRSDELDGDSVVVVEQEDGSTLTVADDDPPYPLELTGGGEDEGTITFSNHGEEEDISAPEGVVSLEELAAG